MNDTKKYAQPLLKEAWVRELTASLIGSTIVDVGFIPDCEGGFTIDFLPSGGGDVQRFVLGYAEIGEGVDYLGRRPELA